MITAATMKLVPLPAAQLTAWAAVPSMEHAVALLGLAHRTLGAGLTGFEVMGQFALSLVARHMPASKVPLYESTPWCVLLEVSDHESEAHALWDIREHLPEAQARNIKHDISVPISRIAEFIDIADAALEKNWPGVCPYTFGHLGDGNLHYNIAEPPGFTVDAWLKEWEKISTLVHDCVHRFGGSISAEHGIGRLKRDEIKRFKSPVEIALMQSIKRTLDPLNIMNPGKVV